MKTIVDRGDFLDLFKSQAIVLSELPSGKAHNLANLVNQSTGSGDVTLRTKAEFHALFELLDTEVDAQVGDGLLTLQDGVGNQTETGKLVSAWAGENPQ